MEYVMTLKRVNQLHGVTKSTQIVQIVSSALMYQIKLDRHEVNLLRQEVMRIDQYILFNL